MNFAEVEKANGQNVNMLGTILEFKGEGINQVSGKAWKKVVITDGTVRHQVTLRGTLPGPEMINQQADFSVSTFQGNSLQHGAYMGYSGFWNSTAHVRQTQQSPPQQGYQQQSSPQPNKYNPPQQAYRPQPTQPPARPPKKDDTDWDKIGRGKTRCALACAILQSGRMVEAVDKSYIDGLIPWIFGDVPTDAENYYQPSSFDPDNPNADDIPF